MKLERSLEIVIKRKLDDIKELFGEFGYSELSYPEDAFKGIGDLFSLSQSLESDQLKINIDLGFIFISPENSWRVFVVLRRGLQHCHLELMLPRLPNPKDPTILCFPGSQDPQELEKNASIAVGNLIEVLKGDFAPFLLGQKWEQTYLPLPKEYF